MARSRRKNPGTGFTTAERLLKYRRTQAAIEAELGRLEDMELNAIASARAGELGVKVKLDELVETITAEDIHDEVDFGAPVGKEQGE